MSLNRILFFAVPAWSPGNAGYTVTLTVSALIAVLVLVLCLVISMKNPGFMRDERKEQKKPAQTDLPKAVSIASSSCEKLLGTPLNIFTPFTKNSGI